MEFEVLILTCDKNSDISEFVLETAKQFEKNGVQVVISTESNLAPFSNSFVVKNNESFSARMLTGLDAIEKDYVLILLDDYYVFDTMLSSKIKKWYLDFERNPQIEVLKICSDGKFYKKTKKGNNNIRLFKKVNVYDIDFHPTIWKKDVLINILKNKSLNPWEIEPLFTSYLNNNNIQAAISSKKIKYDELIVGGRFFRRAFNRHCKNSYQGNRKTLKIHEECLFRVKRFFYHLTPRIVINFFGKITNKKSYSRNK